MVWWGERERDNRAMDGRGMLLQSGRSSHSSRQLTSLFLTEWWMVQIRSESSVLRGTIRSTVSAPVYAAYFGTKKSAQIGNILKIAVVGIPTWRLHDGRKDLTYSLGHNRSSQIFKGIWTTPSFPICHVFFGTFNLLFYPFLLKLITCNKNMTMIMFLKDLKDKKGKQYNKYTEKLLYYQYAKSI